MVEILAQIQEYLWTLQNQRIDALRLLTNVITTIRSDVDDPDAFEFYPGAQWIVEDPGQVGQLQIDATAAQITLEAESLLKGDLQNMLGGLPMAGGVQSGAIDQATATGHVDHHLDRPEADPARKQQYSWASREVGELFLGMMGQMIREERIVPQMGPGGTQELLEIHPLDLQGEFNVNIDVMDESVVRNEKIRGDGLRQHGRPDRPDGEHEHAAGVRSACWRPRASPTPSSTSCRRKPSPRRG